ncbi:hypothetical protein H6F79_28195 [Trichocoleus sp. FACHB-69]|uniref:hypothetical protein n=1 Tax=Trichocoleus sp. FACHB-69 TaxID=2692874 RepID=UPI00168681ED|nr:hypothetical protein [Trichocoleus sp. FACHB-69]MBD1935660.1 hypothetical protein [Trichocoleus sp. FACHB-69]
MFTEIFFCTGCPNRRRNYLVLGNMPIGNQCYNPMTNIFKFNAGSGIEVVINPLTPLTVQGFEPRISLPVYHYHIFYSLPEVWEICVLAIALN